MNIDADLAESSLSLHRLNSLPRLLMIIAKVLIGIADVDIHQSHPDVAVLLVRFLVSRPYCNVEMLVVIRSFICGFKMKRN